MSKNRKTLNDFLRSPRYVSIYLREFLFEVSENGTLRGIKPMEVRWEEDGVIMNPILWFIYSETEDYAVPIGLYGPQDALAWLLHGHDADITPVDVEDSRLSAPVHLLDGREHAWFRTGIMPKTEDGKHIDLKKWLDSFEG